MSEEITRDLLFKYFANKVTAIQKRRIDEWAKSADNLEFFYECLSQWESENLQFASDVEAALTRHQRRRQVMLAPVRTLGGGFSYSLRATLKYMAAACLIIAILFAGFGVKDKILYKTIATRYGEMMPVTLHDGTKVVLNANSTLTIPRFDFIGHSRRVTLKGEANFSVTHLPSNEKFVVQTANGNDIVVLGTEFTVYSRERRFKVALAKGKIQLNYKEKQKQKNLVMNPGELVTINADEGKPVLEKTTNPEKFAAWKESRYVFEHTTLEEICSLLRDDFGLDIEVADPEISSWTVSGAFKASNAEDLLEALAESSGLVYKIENEKVVIHSIKK